MRKRKERWVTVMTTTLKLGMLCVVVSIAPTSVAAGTVLPDDAIKSDKLGDLDGPNGEQTKFRRKVYELQQKKNCKMNKK